MSHPMSPWDPQLAPPQYAHSPPPYPVNSSIGFEGVTSNSQYMGWEYQQISTHCTSFATPPPVQNYYPNAYPANYAGQNQWQSQLISAGPNYGNVNTQGGYPSSYPPPPNFVNPIPPQLYVEPETSKKHGGHGLSKSKKKKLKKYGIPVAAAAAGMVIGAKLF